MKKYGSLILGMIILVVIATGCYALTNGMIDSIYAFRSPLHESPPRNETILTATPSSERVVIILVDSLRLDTSLDRQTMPFVNKLHSQGAWATMHSQAPSYSAPGYSTIFTGAWPYLNDGPAFNMNYPEIPTWTQENLFSLAHQAGLKTAISGFYWFEKLVPQDSVDVSFYTSGEDEQADKDVIQAAIPWLQDRSIQLVLIHIDQVDFAGHNLGGPQNAAWNDSASRADRLIEELSAHMDLSRDTLVIFSDHGQIPEGGHGGGDPDVILEPFIMVGKGIHPGVKPDMQMVDITPTLSVLLSIPQPAISQGEPQWDMLQVDNQARQSIMSHQEVLQNNLNSAFGQAIGENQMVTGKDGVSLLRQMRLDRERTIRFFQAMAFLILTVIIIYLKRTRATIPALFCGIGFVILFHFRWFLLDNLAYSFSTVGSPTELILYIGTTCAGCMLITTVVFHFLLRKQKKTVLEWMNTQLYFIFVLIHLLAIPLTGNYWMNGIFATWTLPNFDYYFIGLSFTIQILIVACLGAISIGITAGIAAMINRKGNYRITPAQ